MSIDVERCRSVRKAEAVTPWPEEVRTHVGPQGEVVEALGQPVWYTQLSRGANVRGYRRQPDPEKPRTADE